MARTQVGTRLLGAGAVIQSAYAQNGTVTQSTAALARAVVPLITAGIQAASVSITPGSSSSKLVMEAGAYYTTDSASLHIQLALFSGSTFLTMVSIASGGAGFNQQHRLDWEVTSGTTSPITFSTRIGNNGSGTFTLNGDGAVQHLSGTLPTFIRVTELQA
jgi:hypothetical protein